MKSHLIIENIESKCIIGINPNERIKKQRVIIDVKLFFPIFPDSNNEDIKNTVNYSSVTKEIKKFVSNSKFNLIETLALKTAEIILQNSLINEVQLQLKKPEAMEVNEMVGVVVNLKK
ncbi:dihydroneopterin aldolase [Dehalococcoidia bacterium]|nr:dihydroneopterin aldolase [Dehalococcoidia bacterium]